MTKTTDVIGYLFWQRLHFTDYSNFKQVEAGKGAPKAKDALPPREAAEGVFWALIRMYMWTLIIAGASLGWEIWQRRLQV